MMSARGKGIWLAHGLIALCALLILGAMAALTRGVIHTERERARMETKADEQEQIRLALWRMDAAAAAFIADEAQRPLPDPGTKEPAKPEVKLRFDAREDGLLLADDPDKIQLLCEVLGLPTRASAFPQMCAQMPEIPVSWNSALPEPAPVDLKSEAQAPLEQKDQVQQKAQVRSPRASTAYQSFANAKEMENRGRAIKGAVEMSKTNFDNNMALNTSVGDWNLLRSSLPRPARIGKELLLLRHLQWKRGGSSTLRSIQGVWLDEPALKTLLLAEVADLFPGASLVPANAGDLQDGSALASFPWKLSVLGREEVVPPLPQAVMIPLAAGWLAAVLAILATWLLVSGLLRLSERRASFVSAVTHELRTPLTTFQLYSEMLAAGAVKEEKRGEYFLTLRREAERLSHLVENVLAFSRIERRCPRSVQSRQVAGELVGPMLERFRGRLGEAGLDLSADMDDAAWQTAIGTDPAAVEHVLFNLIDNAAKYAAGSTPAQVSLHAERSGGTLTILVRDHGKGIPFRERGRIFRAFHKSAAAAAESRPGIGLGLALSRRLARAGGGDLKLRDSPAGACFALSLPVLKLR